MDIHLTSSPAAARAPWYVVKCKPHQEYRALENLQRQDFSCYLPELTVERFNRQCRLAVNEPLFPSYLFIRLSSVDHNWHSISSTRGVSHVVRFNEYPLPLRDELVNAIRGRAAEQSKVPYLQPGERVRIVGGSFSHLEAIFVAYDGNERVVLLMNILQQEHSLSFPVTIVRRCANY